MHSPALRIALLLAMALAASIAATWAKSYLAADDHPPGMHALSGQAGASRHR